MADSQKLQPPTHGEPITLKDGKLQVPDHPIIPFIEGDGTGPDIWAAASRVFDAAVEKAYGVVRVWRETCIVGLVETGSAWSERATCRRPGGNLTR